MAKLYPYLRNRDLDGVWVDGLEIMDDTGYKTINRVNSSFDYSEFMNEIVRGMEGRSVTSIMLCVRHNDEGNLDSPRSDALKRFKSDLESLQDPRVQLEQYIFDTGADPEDLEEVEEAFMVFWMKLAVTSRLIWVN